MRISAYVPKHSKCCSTGSLAVGDGAHRMQACGRTVLYLVVTKVGVVPELKACPPGERYTREGVRALLSLMGCKSKVAHKVQAQVWAKVSAQLPELCRPAHRRPNTQLWGCWPCDDEQSCAVSLSRSDFNELLTSCLAEYNYRDPEKLKLACRCGDLEQP